MIFGCFLYCINFSFSILQIENVPGQPLLCTLFSASNYQDGNNDGAFLVFCAHPFTNSRPAVDFSLGVEVTSFNQENSYTISLSSKFYSNESDFTDIFEIIIVYVVIIFMACGKRMYLFSFLQPRDESAPPRLHYCAYQYKTSESSIGTIEDTNYKSLNEMILKKKTALNSAFEAADTSNLVRLLT